MGPAVVGLVVALLATHASAQNATTPNGTSTCQADALNMHNWLRGIHQAGNLTWSAKLASDAQAWANQLAASNCAVQYASITDGENVISLEPNAAINPCYAAPARWYMNGVSWNYSTTPSNDNRALLVPTAVEGLARAFTQVVWASSMLIGCAASPGSGGCWSVVCRYTQTGIQALGVVNGATGLPISVSDTSLVANVKPPVAPFNLSAAGVCDQSFVAVYNAHRAAHQSPPINWDARLAIGAQAWANVVAKQNCQPVRVGRAQGETGLTGANYLDCAAAAQRHYKDIIRYNFTDTPWTDNENQISKVRPFLNMVLASNTKMGCGTASNEAAGCYVYDCWFGDDMGQYNDTYLLANVKPLQPPVISSEEQARQTAFLARNNQYRAAHGAPPLSWSDQYTAGVQALLYQPQQEVGTDTTGNIFSPEPGLIVFQTNASDATNDTILTLALDAWYATGNTSYKFTSTPYVDNKDQLSGRMLTFAQVIWVSSQAVGCASALDGIWFVLCKYGPSGNTQQLDDAYLQNVLPLGGVQVPSQDSQSSSSSTPVGLIVGVCVGVGVPLLAAVAGLVLWARHRRQQKQKDKQADEVWDSFASPKEKALSLGVPDTTMTGVTGSNGLNSCTVIISPGTQHSGGQGVATVMAIPGLTAGEAFTRATAFAYSWTDAFTPVPGVTQAVESGVNDVQLDARVQSSGGAVQECPVLSLSKEEVQQQLQLLTAGLLGRGGAALVFKALWPSRFGPDALVAVKVLKEGFDCNPYILQSFAHEASVLASVRHPNVVRLYGYCLEPPNVCLIMELLPGSLKQVLYGTKGGANTTAGLALSGTSLHTTSSHANARAETDTAAPAKPPASSLQPAGPSTSNAVPLTMAQVLKYSTDIAAGLAYLHDQPEQPLTLEDGQTAAPLETLAEAGSGTVAEQPSAGTTSKIVHRDLKPANILINSRDVAKITDFGLARRHDNTTIETRHVGAGTVPYQAPEVLSGAQAGAYGLKATNRCDIYSMAMIMWELLAKQPPWNGMNEMAILGAVVHGRRPELPPPQKAGPEVDAAVDVAQLPASLSALPAYNDIIRQCWAQRDMRRPTAGELHSMLVALQQRHVPSPAANA